MARTVSFLLVPGLALVGFFVVYPIFFNFVLAFMEWPLGGSPQFCGLCHFQDFAGDARFQKAFMNTIVLLLVIPLSVAVGLAFALLVHARPLGYFVMAPLVAAGMVIPPSVVGIAWILTLDPRIGAYNVILSAFGVPPRAYLFDPQLQIYALVLLATWSWVGFTFITFLANLESIPQTLYESASIDGASKMQTFVHVTLPQLKPAFIINAIMSILYVLRLFDVIYVLGAESPPLNLMNLAYYVYYLLQYSFELGGPSAVAAVLTSLSLAITYIAIKRAL